MSYRYDSDLHFISNCSDEELEDLFSVVILDENGIPRTTEELTPTDIYKNHHPHHSVYWEEICGELQKFGGNTFANIFRGGDGVLYREILEDVCDKLKVNYSKRCSTAKLEGYLMQKIFDETVENMSSEEREKFCRELGADNTNNATAETLHMVAQAAFRVGGFASYKFSLIVANMVWKQLFGKGLTLATNAGITKVLATWAGPIGWSISILWTAYDVAGPAFRVTIPAVIQVAMLRQKKLYESIAKNMAS